MQVYVLAKNFQCSPTEIMKLSLNDFNEYFKIMNTENGISKKGNV